MTYQVLVYIKYWCTGNFYIKHSRTDQVKNSFSRIGAKIWNSVPDSDRVLPKHKFKNTLQGQLLLYIDLARDKSEAPINKFII